MPESQYRENFRKKLVELVKVSGQEVIDRAEDIVGNGDMLVDFTVHLIFSIDGQLVNECPLIEVTKSYVSKNGMKVLMEVETNEITRNKT